VIFRSGQRLPLWSEKNERIRLEFPVEISVFIGSILLYLPGSESIRIRFILHRFLGLAGMFFSLFYPVFAEKSNLHVFWVRAIFVGSFRRCRWPGLPEAGHPRFVKPLRAMNWPTFAFVGAGLLNVNKITGS